MYEQLVREILGLNDPNIKPEPVFRRKTMDEILEGKGIPRGGAASLTPILEPGSVAAMNAEADAKAAEAAANPPGFTPQWGAPARPPFFPPTSPFSPRPFSAPGELAMDRLNPATPNLWNAPTARAAGTGQFDFGTLSPDPGTVMEHMLERGAQTPPPRPMWNRVPVTQPPAGIDTTTGAPFWDRAALGILVKPEGRYSYVEDRFGKGNAGYSPEGELMFRPTDTNQWTLADEKGPGWGDIADFSGDAIELGSTAAGGFLGGGVPGAMAGAAAGNLLRQAVGEALPGETGMSLGESALRVGASGLTAGAGKKLWDASRVMPRLRKIYADIPKGLEPPVHPPLTPGQLATLDAVAERLAGAGVSIGTGTVLDEALNKPEARKPENPQPDKQPQGPSPHRRRIPKP